MKAKKPVKKAKKAAEKEVYTKTHTNPDAAVAHMKKIKKGGGTVTKEKIGNKIKLTYSY